MRSVRSRLAIVLVTIVIIPAVAAIAAIGWLAPRQINKGALQLMGQSAGAVTGSLNSLCYALGETARFAAVQSDSSDLQGVAKSALSGSQADFVALLQNSQVVAAEGAVPQGRASELTNSPCSASADPIAGPNGGPMWLSTANANDAQAYRIGAAVVGVEITGDFLRRLAVQLGLPAGTEIAISCPRALTASTADPDRTRMLLREAAAGPGERTVAGYQASVESVTNPSGCAVIAAVRQPGLGDQQGIMFFVTLFGLVAGVWLVLKLAGSLTRPILALTEAAERVAKGDLSQRLPRIGDDELGRLSGAFNVMTDELELTIGQLRGSRDLLRQNVSRLGDTLERTHDLEGLLGTVLGAAQSATVAQRGTAWLVEGGSVVARATVPPASRSVPRRLPLGQELPGEVAQDGRPRRLVAGHGDSTSALAGPVLAAPLRRGAVTVGVIVVERESTGAPFEADDEAMLVSLAGPAGIAVDNVLLHREAQRLSVTDPLTGVGNLRHMTTTLAREVERASRFDRPLSVLLLDLDHFKGVNDTYGHTVGDAVLRELARRVATCVREVDTVARYGGEEFVIVTPETDTMGAQRLAERVCEVVRSEPFGVGAEAVAVTVSIGIASLPAHGVASGDLVRAADDGLYVAKRAGRDCWRVAPTAPAGSPQIDLTPGIDLRAGGHRRSAFDGINTGETGQDR